MVCIYGENPDQPNRWSGSFLFLFDILHMWIQWRYRRLVRALGCGAEDRTFQYSNKESSLCPSSCKHLLRNPGEVKNSESAGLRF